MNIWVNDHLASSLGHVFYLSAMTSITFFFFLNLVWFENSSPLFLTFDLVLKTVQHWMIISVQDCSGVCQTGEGSTSVAK